MHNIQLIRELLQVLDDMNYFTVYPTSRLRETIQRASTDSDRIRAILRDRDVQEYLFPDFKEKRGEFPDPRQHYIALCKKGVITGR